MYTHTRTHTTTPRSIQRAIMELLFKPANDASANAARRVEGGGAKDFDDNTALMVHGGDSFETGEGSLMMGALGLHRRWKAQQKGENRAFSCMLWCTVALGAMTSNLCNKTVRALTRRVRASKRCRAVKVKPARLGLKYKNLLQATDVLPETPVLWVAPRNTFSCCCCCCYRHY